MDPQPLAPPVVAVVVTCDPGPWLEESLAALAAQDYPNLSVLVIDTASYDDPTPRVASVTPNAYVRRLPDRVGFSQAANEVLAIVEGASHYLLCHDDVAPEPDTIRVLVEEAFRSNAGIVSPKMVGWRDPSRLLAVGQSVDKTGVVADLVDVGELDQEQHDSVRDVFCAPGGCMLVRADLFATLGGFDPGIDLCGEALNLSWRAQVAGARVVVAPAVRVRHVQALSTGQREGWQDRRAATRVFALEEEHRIRTILTCYSLFHLLRVLPQALALTLAQSTVQLVTGRPAMAQATFLAWPRALRHFGSLVKARWSVQRHRRVRDAEVRKLQTPGSANLRAFVRSALAGESPLDALAATKTISSRLGSKSWRALAATWILVVLVLLIGSRSLLGGSGLPGVGTFPVFSSGPASLWHLWWSGWRPDGLGSAAAAPPALALLGMAGTLLLGGVGVLQKLLVLGPLLLGPLGAYRSSKPLGSPLARAAVVVAYAAVPLPFNALAGGRWPGLVAYALAPWLLASLCRLGGDGPFVAKPRRPARVIGLGLLVALGAAFVPALLLVVPLVGVGLAVGSVLAGRPVPGLRALAASIGATVVAAVLLFPWSFDLLQSRTSVFGVSLASHGAPRLTDILRFDTGPIGHGPLGWGLLVAAALPLLFGRSWRLAWASRMWGVALCCWLLVWAAGRGFLPLPMANPEVFLAPAAAALALSVGLGALAFKMDLPGYSLGWRQLASMAAAVGLAVASFSLLAASGGGRWNIPQQDFASTLTIPTGPAFRVLWVGDPRALPLGSWQYQSGVGYATSIDGPPDVTDQWPPQSAGATTLLATDLRLASGRLTTQLGHLLAPLAVRYIIIPSQTAPAGTGGSAVPVPNQLLAALDQQTDLKAIPIDDALQVYQNVAWAPGRALLTPAEAGDASQATNPAASQFVDLSGATAVLPAGGSDAFRGQVPADGQVLVSESDQANWTMSVAGTGASRARAFGWAMLFTAPSQGGKTSLHYDTPITGRGLSLLEVALWLVAVAILLSERRRRWGGDGEPSTTAPVPSPDPTEPVVEPVIVGIGTHRKPRRVTVPAIGDDEEFWA